jgi:hypothetical protein
MMLPLTQVYTNFKHNRALFSWLLFNKKFATFSTLSPSHHIKYTKRHMFGALNVGKKLLITQF